MDGVILYQSKYGAAKKYADWLAEETGYPCMETKKADIKELRNEGILERKGSNRNGYWIIKRMD